jgi:hypothetical protein
MEKAIVVADQGDGYRQFLDLGYPLLRCDAQGYVSDTRSTSEVPLSDLQQNALCVLAVSPDGLRKAESLCARFGTELGADPLLLIDLTDTAPDQRQAKVLSHIVDVLLHEQLKAAQRQVELLRDMAHLRAEFEELSNAFGLLEGFVREAELDHRQLRRDLAPASNTKPVALSSGSVLHQRLPGKSSGICDIGVHLAHTPAGSDGQLLIKLRALEKGETLADWSIEQADLSAGWLRLPLDVALGPDDTTLQLHLEWTGATPLELDWSLRHPDPRYCLQISEGSGAEATEDEDRVLALQLWAYIPGCAAPQSGDGRGLKVLPQAALKAARNLNPENTDTKYLEQLDVLQVHPVQGDLAAALLCDAAGQGINQITTNIHSLSDQATDIEFSIALAPTSARIDPAGNRRAFIRRRSALEPSLNGLMESPGAQKSEWYRLSAGQKGHVSLLLSKPTDAAMDIYLITRMADPQLPPSWAWAAFSSVTLCRDRF